jgi:hypothetical protein
MRSRHGTKRQLMTKNQKLLVRLCLLACSLSLFAATADAQTLTRGPYLQNGSTSAISIRWRTSAATDSVVRYGLSAGSLTEALSDGALVREHERAAPDRAHAQHHLLLFGRQQQRHPGQRHEHILRDGA